MHSLFNKASVAPGCVFSLEMPGFLRLVAVGRLSDWVLVELELPVTPGSTGWNVEDVSGSGA